MNVQLLGVTAVVLSVLSGGAMAQHRCIENGKTIITDRPCADEPKTTVPIGNAPKVIGDAGNTAYSSPYGDWRGDAQFQFNRNGQLVGEAHAVVPMTISISQQGKVVGVSPQNGCTAKGIASPGIAPHLLSLDLTFSGCSFSGYNKRMSGHLSLNTTQQVAQLSLSGIRMLPLNPNTEAYDIKAAMRR